MFGCNIPGCGWWKRVLLPLSPKTILYLDTYVISSMVRNTSDSSPWRRLQYALADAAADESVCCVISEISRAEFELSPPLASAFTEMAETFNDPGACHRLDVQLAQLCRALDRFLAGTAPELETDPPLSDAFHGSISEWRPLLGVYINDRDPPVQVVKRRATKESIFRTSNSIYARYAQEALSSEQIYQRELGGFGEGQIQDFAEAFNTRCAVLAGEVTLAEALGNMLATTFEILKDCVLKETGSDSDQVLKLTVEFFRSDHVRALPLADIGAHLHSHLAMSVRGPMPRKGKSSDHIDIDHIATFVPYVDILLTDKYFADLCNQANARIGEPYGTKIMSINPDGIDSFVEALTEITSVSPRAQLSRRMRKALADGGYVEESIERLKRLINGEGTS